VIAYTPELYPHLKDQLTAGAIQGPLCRCGKGRVDRYAVDGLGALNFVAQEALGGGVSRSLCLDNYGKSLSSRCWRSSWIRIRGQLGD
jgi:hypothetical protein